MSKTDPATAPKETLRTREDFDIAISVLAKAYPSATRQIRAALTLEVYGKRKDAHVRYRGTVADCNLIDSAIICYRNAVRAMGSGLKPTTYVTAAADRLTA